MLFVFCPAGGADLSHLPADDSYQADETYYYPLEYDDDDEYNYEDYFIDFDDDYYDTETTLAPATPGTM